MSGKGMQRERLGSRPEEEVDTAIDRRLQALLLQTRASHGIFAAPARKGGSGATVVVGVSGGADSVTLLHLLAGLREAWSIDLVAAHLDHGLRVESGDDAAFVAEISQDWEVPLESAALPRGALAGGGNLEAAARRARYRFLAEIAAGRRADGKTVEVAVAHTANDQAETVLMNLIRGSGLDGLAGMRAARPLFVDDRPVPGVQLVRPLLGATRDEILQYLARHRLPWREDPSNRDRSLVRNRLRHEILPQLEAINPRVVASLCRTATLLAAEAERSDRHTRAAMTVSRRDGGSALERELRGFDGGSRTAGHCAGSDRQVFDLAAFRGLTVAEQRSALRAGGLCLGLVSAGINFDAVERLRRTLLEESSVGGPFTWVADVMLTRAAGCFSLHRAVAAPFAVDHPYLDSEWRSRHGGRRLHIPGEIAVPGWTLHCELLKRGALRQGWSARLSQWEAYMGAERVGQLALAAPQPGQRFAQLGLGGHGKRLSDYLTDRKVPRWLRSGWPILVDGTEVVWVGGHQIADRVRIDENSREVIHLYWRESS
ncbi:MAG: tRNA lysidine(34) synthetase TilS [Caldilineaceae bacterium]|nr:tRNA lysidine(34) synthetase TilS [Caldilineaceae bacterium]